jgi:GPH family glycoside/pentoside/hexuronide:cation symporter
MEKLSNKIKLAYGFGFSAQGIKDGIFQVFLFFYFSQILGLSATLTGLASIISLLFDAVSDPYVGYLSDKWKSKNWGRRHPLMFMSALPLGIFVYLLFIPPAGLDETGLFLWLTVFTILVRLALTLFIVPAMALGAELTTNYDERTTVTSYRIMFGAFLGPFIILFGLLTFFTPTEANSNGLFNVDAYPKFAMLCAFLIIISILVSTWGTRQVIPSLPQKNSDSDSKLSDLWEGLKIAIKMKSYSSLVVYIMVVYIVIGVGTVFSTYFSTYFFELSEKELAALPISAALGGILALFIAPMMGKKMDKKKAVIMSTMLFSFFFGLPYNLRLLGLFPENGSPNLLLLFVLTLLVAYLFLWVALSLSNSMMADVVDEYELKTGNRQEGLFFSTMSFAYKCTVGFGYLIAGVLLDIIAFPKQAAVGEIPDGPIFGLGLIGGPILLILYLSSLIFVIRYPIDKARYEEIRAGLKSMTLK